jgi:hypothetical protein
MKRPTTEQLNVAIAWLRSNEGDGGESESCAVVAEWIEHLEQSAVLTAAARKGGVSVKALRERLKKVQS